MPNSMVRTAIHRPPAVLLVVGPAADEATDFASAALLDTVHAVLEAASASGGHAVLAYEQRRPAASRARELAEAIHGCTVIPLRGRTAEERVLNALADVATLYPGSPTVELGWTTPQVDPSTLSAIAYRVWASSLTAVVGSAVDGGPWLVALSDPRLAAHLAPRAFKTASDVEVGLHEAGLAVARAPALHQAAVTRRG